MKFLKNLMVVALTGIAWSLSAQAQIYGSYHALTLNANQNQQLAYNSVAISNDACMLLDDQLPVSRTWINGIGQNNCTSGPGGVVATAAIAGISFSTWSVNIDAPEAGTVNVYIVDFTSGTFSTNVCSISAGNTSCSVSVSGYFTLGDSVYLLANETGISNPSTIGVINWQLQ